MSGPLRTGRGIAAAIIAGLLAHSSIAIAAGADLGQAERQATNWTAISMFAMFVVVATVNENIVEINDDKVVQEFRED